MSEVTVDSEDLKLVLHWAFIALDNHVWKYAASPSDGSYAAYDRLCVATMESPQPESHTQNA